MILVDANLLIFAATKCPEQNAAKTWLDEQLNGTTPVGLPWPSLLTFLRIVTNVRVYGAMASTVNDAWAQIEAWLGCGNVWVPQPTDKHPQILRETLKHAGAGGDLVPDAHLAALAMEHGLTLYSADGDFGRFPGLKWVNPLIPQPADRPFPG